MSKRQLSLVERPRSVPTQFEGRTLPDCAVEWSRAGWDIHPTRADGVKIQCASLKAPKNEGDVLRAFEGALGPMPGMRLAVNLPADVMVVEVRPREVRDESSRLIGKLRTESWRETLEFIGSKFDPHTTLSRCPCHRISGELSARLWLKVPEGRGKPDSVVTFGPDNTVVYFGEALIHVPPAGSASQGTRASWMAPPLSGDWNLPPCPDALWEEIIACDRNDLGCESENGQ